MKYIVFQTDSIKQDIIKLGEYPTQDEAFDAGRTAGIDFSVLFEGTNGKQAIGVGSLRRYKQQNGRYGTMWNIVLF